MRARTIAGGAVINEPYFHMSTKPRKEQVISEQVAEDWISENTIVCDRLHVRIRRQVCHKYATENPEACYGCPRDHRRVATIKSRRFCSMEGCGSYAQRDGLCIRHKKESQGGK